jgi:hypothetical protein
MNPDTNTFYEGEQQASNHIPFTVGEELDIKGHVFKVVHIDIPGLHEPTRQHLLVLTPVRKP